MNRVESGQYAMARKQAAKTQALIEALPVDVYNLLELIATDTLDVRYVMGRSNPLSLGQLQKWRPLIMYAIARMEYNYEHSGRFKKHDNVRRYYASCWKAINIAKNDIELIKAIEELRGSIEMK